MQVLYKDLGTIIPKKYAGRIIGWYTSYDSNQSRAYGKEVVLISSAANTKNSIALTDKGRLNPIILKCGECKKDMGDNCLILGGKIFGVNLEGEPLGTIEVEYNSVYSVTVCPKCEHKACLKIAAILWCNKCNKQVAWLEAGKTKEGFEIKPGIKLHANSCTGCNKKGPWEIIEMKEVHNANKSKQS